MRLYIYHKGSVKDRGEVRRALDNVKAREDEGGREGERLRSEDGRCGHGAARNQSRGKTHYVNEFDLPDLFLRRLE